MKNLQVLVDLAKNDHDYSVFTRQEHDEIVDFQIKKETSTLDEFDLDRIDQISKDL